MPFQAQLTPQQAAYLSKLLPSSYSFQLEVKPLKRVASTSKSMKEPAKTAAEEKKKPAKVCFKLFRTKQKTKAIRVWLAEVKKQIAIDILRKYKTLFTKNIVLKITIAAILSRTLMKLSSPVFVFSTCSRIAVHPGLLDSL